MVVVFPGELPIFQFANRTKLRVHFLHHHVQDTIVILEEGREPALSQVPPV